ncbi:MAG: bifunctional diaminohydroxyphosphoribosylaminopyrimidine deaminase/5-amino-6-(5-phosphoribosylamino)uracil reductase RibD [Gammaproteobacteria bacterium]
MTDGLVQDEHYMRRALRLAVKGLRTCAPNPAVGCVIVNNGRVVSEGFHARAGEPHAELFALRQAGEQARGATAYVTLEPCSHHGRTPPCASALIEAGVSCVVVAARDPNPLVAGNGVKALQDAGIAVQVGLGEAQTRRINRGFFSRFERGRPWLTLKLAASLDGKSALADGTSQWITGPVARVAVHRSRARAAAVLTGVGTVLADDPALNVRLPIVSRQPVRVVLDSKLSTPQKARLFSEAGGPVHFFCTTDDGERRTALEEAGATIHVVAADANGHPQWEPVLHALAELGINEVYAECGPRMAGALIGASLVDELDLFQGPHLLGPGARAFAVLDEQTWIPDPPRWRVVRTQRVGRDARIRLQPEKE